MLSNLSSSISKIVIFNHITNLEVYGNTDKKLKNNVLRKVVNRSLLNLLFSGYFN
jgi:hypothetical protein